jgi:hypothetical protein
LFILNHMKSKILVLTQSAYGSTTPRWSEARVRLPADVRAYMEVPAGMTAPLGTTTTPSRM